MEDVASVFTLIAEIGRPKDDTTFKQKQGRKMVAVVKEAINLGRIGEDKGHEIIDLIIGYSATFQVTTANFTRWHTWFCMFLSKLLIEKPKQQDAGSLITLQALY